MSLDNTSEGGVLITLAKRSAESGVSSAGLMTQVQPAARAAATLRPIMAMGKFHCGKEIGHLFIPHALIQHCDGCQ